MQAICLHDVYRNMTFDKIDIMAIKNMITYSWRVLKWIAVEFQMKNQENYYVINFFTFLK